VSTFLSIQPFLIAAGTTRGAAQTTIDGKLTAQGWQRITYDTVNFISDFIPPVTETIGDGTWKQVTRIYYNATDISISMYDYPIVDAAAQMFRLYAKTAGAVTPTAYIGSSTQITMTASISGTTLTVTAISIPSLSVGCQIKYAGSPAVLYITALGTGTGGTGTYTLSSSLGSVPSQAMTSYAVSVISGATGSAGSTANDNLYSLWTTLATSVDANVLLWKYTYLPNVGQVDSILMERKVVSAAPLDVAVLPAATVNLSAQGDAIVAGTPTNMSLASALFGKFSVTVDYTNSFYVYLGIFARSFSIGVKTTINFFGPIFAYYSLNADALAMVPPSPAFSLHPRCHIMEGAYGLVSGTAAASNQSYTVRVPSAMAFAQSWFYASTANTVLASANINACGGSCIPGYFDNYTSQGYHTGVSATSDNWVAYASAIGTPNIAPTSATVDVAPIALTTAFSSHASSGVSLTGICPAMLMEDIFACFKPNTDASEVTCVAGLPSPANITIQQDLDDTTAYTSILLNTTTGLASSGTNYIVLNQEVFTYTGTSGGNTITGVVRGYNGTPQRRHFIGDQALQGGWYIKINGGYIYAGLTRPVAS
jgi:hypothetical protein